MPADNDLVLDFAADFQVAVDAGQPADLAVICRDRPDLIPAVEEVLRDGGHLDVARAAVAAAPSEPDADDEPMPERLGRYEFDHELGKGAFGVAFRARDTQLNRDVAVKLLRRKWADRPEVARRFLDEARVTAQLQHPAIPAVHEVGTHGDGRPWMAMKLIRGHTLIALLRANDPTLNRLAVFEAVCQGLSYAHSKGVIHRDLKPENVMVGAFGEVQLMDWGLVKVLGPAAAGGGSGPDETAGTAILSDRESDGTRGGSAVGTPSYMPPEQAIGAVDKVDRRSDVFGLGGVLCHLLTGKPPFVGGDAESTRQMAAMGKVADAFARLDASGADPELATLCKRCLSPDQADRPADAGAVASAVAALRAAADDRARRAEVDKARAEVQAVAERKRRAVTRWASIAILVTLGAGAAVALAFAFDARKEADRANLNEQDAVKAAADAERAKDAAIVARTETQRTLAKMLLAPISTTGEDPFDRHEREAVWRLTALRSEPVGLMLAAEATTDPLTAHQFRNRGEVLLNAVIGPNSQRKAEMDDLMARRIRDRTQPQDLKLQIALLAADTRRDGGATGEVVEALLSSFGSSSPVEVLELGRALVSVLSRLPADETTNAREKATNAMLALLTKTSSWEERAGLADALAKVVQCLPEGKRGRECVRVADALAAVLENASGTLERPVVAMKLAAVVQQLPTDKAIDLILAALSRASGGTEQTHLLKSLALLRTRLPAERASLLYATVAEKLLADMGGTTSRVKQGYLAAGLSAVTPHLPAEQAAENCGRAAELLLAAQGKARRADERRAVAAGLAAVARHLPAERAADLLLSALGKAATGPERQTLAMGLATTCGRLPTPTATEVSEKAVNGLAAALERATATLERRAVAAGLAAVAQHLPAERAADLLVAALEKDARGREQGNFAVALAVVVGSLDTGRTTALCSKASDILLAALGKATGGAERWALTGGLLAVTRRLPAVQATKILEKAAEQLAATIGKEVLDFGEGADTAKGLAAVAQRLPVGKAAIILQAALEEATAGDERRALAEGLALVAPRLPADRAITVCFQAAEAMATSTWARDTSDTVFSESLARVAKGEKFPGLKYYKLASELAPLAGSLALIPDIHPRPHPLPPQQLVDLLKHPFIILEARRGVLDALEFTYNRKFADLWDFVAFAEKEHRELDLLTPPKRLAKK